MRVKRTGVALAVGLVVLAIPGSASAATQLGQLPAGDPDGGCVSGLNNAQVAVAAGNTYQVPGGGGVITSWQHRGDSAVPGSGRLQVWRQTGTVAFTLVGRSDVQVFQAGVVNSFPVQIPVSGGELLGLRITSQSSGCSDVTFLPGDVHRYDTMGSPDPAPGDVSFLVNASAVRLNVTASLEPDCDADGFGDETQDGDISSCTPDVTAPETTITDGPKNVVKTKKKRAKVTFTFVSSEPGTFECSLDGAPFTPCSSPSTHKVKAGRRKPKEHAFQVRAVDAAGNTDPAPAADDFKAKRKRKRKK
jgi:hypothetical protein